MNKSITLQDLRHGLLAVMLIDGLSVYKVAKACNLHSDTVRRIIYNGSTTRHDSLDIVYLFVQKWLFSPENFKHAKKCGKLIRQMENKGVAFALDIVDPIDQAHSFFHLKLAHQKRHQRNHKTPFIVISIISVMMFVICLIILTAFIDV